jgi:hypothetical protein
MGASLRFEGHLTEECLIRLLDGELEKGQRDLAVRHLESCWACRRKREQFGEAMDRFVEFEEALIDTSVIPPPANWSGFRSRLRIVSASNGQHAKPITFPASLRVALAPGVLVFAVLLALWLAPVRAVSAKEVFERSTSSEQALLTKTGNALVVQRLRVESAGSTAHWSVWRASSAGRFRQSWDAPGDQHLRADLEQLYTKHGLDSMRPLSAANHSEWRRSLVNHTDSVRQEGELVRVLTRDEGQSYAGQIVEAQLLVRASDWHPVEQSFTVVEKGAERQYRIVETEFQVEPLNAVTARIFEPSKLPEVQMARLPSVSVPQASEPVMVPVDPPPGPGLIETEVEALALLHDIDADRQESARVERGEKLVRVIAYALTADRKALIEQRLAGLASLETVVYLLSETQPSSPKNGVTIIASAHSSTSGPPMFLGALIERTGSPAAANILVSRQLDSLRQVAVELGAVDRLARRFPGGARNELTQSGRNRLDALALDHLTSARQAWAETEQYSALMLGVIGAPERLDSSSSDEGACGEWHRMDASPTEAAWRLENLFARAFTTLAGAPPSSVSESSMGSEVALLRAKLARTLSEGCLY